MGMGMGTARHSRVAACCGGGGELIRQRERNCLLCQVAEGETHVFCTISCFFSPRTGLYIHTQNLRRYPASGRQAKQKLA